MNNVRDEKYTLRREDNSLVFITSSYRAERGSVLHRDIYNREFASLLASMAVSGLVYTVLFYISGNAILIYVLIAAVLPAGFLLFRRFVFKSGSLEIVFNKLTGMAELSLVRLAGKKRETFPVKNIVDVSVEEMRIEVENPDGMEFVKKISLQHGMVMPGFGERRSLYILKLIFSGGTDRIIHVSDDPRDVISVQAEIKEFLKIK